MFKVGEKYDFEMLDARDDKGNPDVNTMHQREVVAVDGPLVEFRDGNGATVIINTHSSIFVRAKVSRALGESKFHVRKPPGSA
jgi:hypothetical protein